MNTVIKPDPLKIGKFRELRNNPDRGWRLETYITLGKNTVMFNRGYTPTQYLDRELQHYKDTPLNLVQVYVYLTEYIKKPLDDEAFKQLEDYLNALKERHLRALLRFAYEYEDNRKIGPTSERILSHMGQIKEWMQNNRELVRDTVMVLQAGFVGVWGEWHTSKHFHSKKQMLINICDMVPEFLTVQTRLQKFKDKIKDLPESKIVGYHDDYLVGIYHKWSAMNSGPGTAAFKRFVEDSRYTLNDGEMPWGRDRSFNGGYIDGPEMLKACQLRSLTSLSLTHNFTEEANCWNAHRWMNEYISPEYLDKLEIPYMPTYFDNFKKRSVFNFMSDYLGYLLTVDKIELEDEKAHITITNKGFALPFGFTDFSLFIKKENEVKEYRCENFDFRCLSGGKTEILDICADCKNAKAVGIKLKKPIECLNGIRLANECEFTDDINWFNI